MVLIWTALALVLFFLRYRPPAAEADLYPVPDAIQYSAAAWNIATGQGYTVELGGQTLPPRYPIGFPLTLVPVFLLGGTELHHASLAVLVTAMALFVPLALFTKKLFNVRAAAWAVLFTGLSPLLIDHSTRVMSEALTLLLVATIYLLEANRARPLTLGLVAGYAAIVRYTNLFALLPTVLRILTQPRGRRVRDLAVLALAVTLYLVPLAAFRYVAFGSVSRDGYHFWHPDRYENAGFTFGWDYAFRSPTVTWTPHPTGLLEQYARDLAGVAGHFYSPMVPILALIGLTLSLRRDRAMRDAGKPEAQPVSIARFLSFPLFLYLFYSFYYGEDRRFLLPMLIPFTALAGYAADRLCERFIGWRRWAVPLALIGALAATSAKSALQPPAQKPQLRYLYAKSYAESLPDDAILVSSLDVLYLEYYVKRGTHRTIIAADAETPHATVLAPRPIPPSPQGSLRPRQYRRWALEHGARDPVPVFLEPSSAQFLSSGRPMYLDLAAHERRLLQVIRDAGYAPEPMTPVGPRRLYRLHQPPVGAALSLRAD